MADNINVSEGTGRTIAADDVGGVLFQRVKLNFGADGSATDVSAATPLPVIGTAVEVSTTLARPADTNAYSATDAVSTSTTTPSVLTFTNVARNAQGSGYLVKANLMTNQKTNSARHRLHLFNIAPTAINDNAAQTLLWANRAGYVGSIDFAGLATEDATASDAAVSINTSPRLPFVCAAGDRNLYGMLETLDAYTPASAQSYYVALTTEQN
jgi:hypothetical protein